MRAVVCCRVPLHGGTQQKIIHAKLEIHYLSVFNTLSYNLLELLQNLRRRQTLQSTIQPFLLS